MCSRTDFAVGPAVFEPTTPGSLKIDGRAGEMPSLSHSELICLRSEGLAVLSGHASPPVMGSFILPSLACSRMSGLRLSCWFLLKASEALDFFLQTPLLASTRRWAATKSSSGGHQHTHVADQESDRWLAWLLGRRRPFLVVPRQA